MDPVTDKGLTPDSPGQEPIAEPKPEGQAPPAPKTFDEDYVKTLRAENAATRKAKSELETRLKAIEDAQLSDQEKQGKRLLELEAERTTREARIRELTVLTALKDAAVAAGMTKPKALARLADLSVVQVGDNGEPTSESVEAAVAGLKKEYPEFFGVSVPSSGLPTNGARGTAEVPFDPKNAWGGVTFKG